MKQLLMNLRTVIPALALAFVALPLSARAAERVTLANGFAQGCHHHGSFGNSVRLYLDSAENSYIDIPREQIVTIETVPDEPVAPAASRPPKSESALTPTDLAQILSRAGEQHNLDVDLLASIVKAESDGNVHAVSRAGAQGLMQLMPATAAGLGVQDSFQPDQNVQGGSAYLDSLLTLYHDNLALALAAYNAGPQAVAKYHGIPPYRETQVYIAGVIHEFNRRVRARDKDQKNAPRVTRNTASR